MDKHTFFDRIGGGLIVSCYADADYNVLFDHPNAMEALATSVVRGGAVAIRVNAKHVEMIKKATEVPVIGIQKIYRDGEMRITPTLNEVAILVKSGVDAVAIDATKRTRFDGLLLAQYIGAIKREYPVAVIGDISTYEEAVSAAESGIDAVGTTLSGYTPYSFIQGNLGEIPAPPPDIELVKRLSKTISIPIIAEGRYKTPERAAQALAAGAHAVVVGTAISNPQKIVELFVHTIQGGKGPQDHT